jgi:hypothetical protein
MATWSRIDYLGNEDDGGGGTDYSSVISTLTDRVTALEGASTAVTNFSYSGLQAGNTVQVSELNPTITTAYVNMFDAHTNTAVWPYWNTTQGTITRLTRAEIWYSTPGYYRISFNCNFRWPNATGNFNVAITHDDRQAGTRTQYFPQSFAVTPTTIYNYTSPMFVLAIPTGDQRMYIEQANLDEVNSTIQMLDYDIRIEYIGPV